MHSHKQAIKQAMEGCRDSTLKLLAGVDHETFCCQPHPSFSPVGWHLGHIAYTEALWLLQNAAKLPPLFPEYHRRFAAEGLPKSERVKLPPLSEILVYLETVREKVFEILEAASLATAEQQSLWWFIIQHESQHCETISWVLQMRQAGMGGMRAAAVKEKPEAGMGRQFLTPLPAIPMVNIPAGEFEMGSDDTAAMDNEKPRHSRYLETYQIDVYPVTCGQYRRFMAAGGYETPRWWSKKGWEWLRQSPVSQPFYWLDSPEFQHHPVCGVSWYEAEAYCNFVGKRLPTEAEWEKAASWNAADTLKLTYPWGETQPNDHLCNHGCVAGIPHNGTTPVDAYAAGVSPAGCYDLLGNVWEWTASWFDGYAGFQFYPYPGYSQTYFDGHHRILKGGSWATRPWVLRSSFRNWYYPEVREIFAGFRCAV